MDRPDAALESLLVVVRKLLHLASLEMRRKKSSILSFPAVAVMEGLDRRPAQHSSLCVAD